MAAFQLVHTTSFPLTLASIHKDLVVFGDVVNKLCIGVNYSVLLLNHSLPLLTNVKYFVAGIQQNVDCRLQRPDVHRLQRGLQGLALHQHDG